MNIADLKKLKEAYRKRDLMFHEISLLLEDWHIIDMIGDRTFYEFMDAITQLMPYHCEPQNYDRVKGKVGGHNLTVIKYYCDTFNRANNE